MVMTGPPPSKHSASSPNASTYRARGIGPPSTLQPSKSGVSMSSVSPPPRKAPRKSRTSCRLASAPISEPRPGSPDVDHADAAVGLPAEEFLHPLGHLAHRLDRGAEEEVLL